MGWLNSNNRKRHQRAVNKIVRKVNKAIEEDPLWRGRFVIRQIQSRFHHYEDGSGSTLWVLLRFYDKKTGITMDIFESSLEISMWNGTKISWAMNKFITEKCQVWQFEDPRKDKMDYRDVKFDEKLNLAYNYYSRFE